MALGILKASDFDHIVEAIENENVAFIKTLPGIGNKTASQIILDLRGKIARESEEKDEDLAKLNDVSEALKSLGYKPQEIKKVIKQIAKEDLKESEYLRKALSLLKK